MGFIKYFDGRLPNGSLYVGWIDAKTSEPVDDKDVRGKYEKEILSHAGVRLIRKLLCFLRTGVTAELLTFIKNWKFSTDIIATLSLLSKRLSLLMILNRWRYLKTKRVSSN